MYRRSKNIPLHFFFTIVTNLLMQASGELHYNSDNGGYEGIDVILEVLRERHSLSSGDGSKWSDALDQWISDVGQNSFRGLPGYGNGEYMHSLPRDSIWKLWNTLQTSTREHVLKKLYHFLISDPSLSSENEWTLHCTDAHALCMTDTNCYYKYAYFLSSCSEKDLSALERLEPTVKPRHYHQVSSRRRQKNVRSSVKRSVKRDVHFVQKRMRKKAKSEKKRKVKNREKNLLWMGRYVSRSKFVGPFDFLRYFSLSKKTNICSPKCVQSLMLLNDSIYGNLLAHCDCRAKTMPTKYKEEYFDPSQSSAKPIETEQVNLKTWEETCLRHQQTAQVCRPRIFTGKDAAIGCTEARQRCERNETCKKAQEQFLSRCSQVINGLRCSAACRESVELLRTSTKLYETCICDGTEGPTCTQIRSHVFNLCDIRTEQTPSQIANIKASKGSNLDISARKLPNFSAVNDFDRFHILDHNSRTLFEGDSSRSNAKSIIFSRENYILIILLAVKLVIW